MSNVLYPLSAIETLEIERVNAVLSDPFEDGTTSSRLKWAARTFKRRFHLRHAPLRSWEAEALLAFHAARSGAYDSFYFRDHIFRTGSANVRFAPGLKLTRERLMTGAEVMLEEVAPSGALPTLEELVTAAGNTPLAWLDPARVKYFTHPASAAASTLYSDTTVLDSMANYDATWQHGSALYPKLYTGADDYWNFTGTQWAKTGNPSQLSGTQPALTLMCFFKYTANPGFLEGVPLFVGATGAATGLGVFQTNGSNWKITDGSTRYGTSLDIDIPAWQSIAVSVASASNSVDLLKNGAVILNQSITRNHTAGPLTVGAYSDGTKKLNDAGVMALAAVSQVLLWNAKLTTAQVKAVHNLFAPVFALPQVA